MRLTLTGCFKGCLPDSTPNKASLTTESYASCVAASSSAPSGGYTIDSWVSRFASNSPSAQPMLITSRASALTWTTYVLRCAVLCDVLLGQTPPVIHYRYPNLTSTTTTTKVSSAGSARRTRCRPQQDARRLESAAA